MGSQRIILRLESIWRRYVIGHYKNERTERKAELDVAKGMVQSWKASYEGNYLVGENAVDVP